MRMKNDRETPSHSTPAEYQGNARSLICISAVQEIGEPVQLHWWQARQMRGVRCVVGADGYYSQRLASASVFLARPSASRRQSSQCRSAGAVCGIGCSSGVAPVATQKSRMGAGCPMSALPPKADMDRQGRDVRFVPKADILRCGTALLFDHLVGAGEQ